MPDDDEPSERARDRATRGSLWLVLPPIVAVALLAFGLRVGAGSPLRAAIVQAAPPPKTLTGLAWQVLVVRQNGAVRETLANLPITVDVGGASWSGTTNADGVAEVVVARPDLAVRSSLDVAVTADDTHEVLARGAVQVPTTRAAPRAGLAAVRPARRDGAVALDLVVRDGVLVASHPDELWVRASDAASGAPIVGAKIEARPEPGLTFSTPSATTCRNGWAALDATPQVHVVSTGLAATTAEGRSGEWFGNLPVARGAAWAPLATSVHAGASWNVDLILPDEGRTGYVEIDDEHGRAFATTFVSRADPPGPPHALVKIPPLGAGLYWLVTSGDPGGAESPDDLGATVARPFLVLGAPADRCDEIAELAKTSPPSFAREKVLDGLVPAREREAERRSRGLTIGLSSLAVAAALETLLVVRRARRARARALSVLVGVCVVLLGFALLALLATARPG